MTKEEWKRHQVGMAEKWPLPAYMNGQKGHMQFKSETYSIVTCWTAETRIRYRPHAKAPGSKSHLRYERYALAKTVGEALALSSYPVDWCWDYERGFLKVLGGPIRDEPLDLAKVDDESTLTDVDRCINSWYRKELAKSLGMPVKELSDSAGWGESAVSRGQRLLAQRESKEFLEAADREGRHIADEEVLAVLKRWPFFRNPWRRNVMKDGQTWVFSDTLGLLRDRQGDIHLTAPTRRYPQVAELMARWLVDRLPEECRDFKFTSMNVNCNYAAQMHRDNGNFGPSFIKAFGDFSGGQLNYWPRDTGGDLAALRREGHKETFDLKRSLALFNGNCAHSVEAFAGSRYSVVYFTLSCHPDMLPGDREKLQQLGLLPPARSEDPFTLLRPPSHKMGTARSCGKDQLPYYRVFDSSRLSAERGVRPRKAAAKKRLAPENAKTFYTAVQRQGSWEARKGHGADAGA